MAIKLNFTDSYGENYPESYWKPVQINFCEADQNGQITFYGYPKVSQKGKRIVGQKSYALDAARILTYLKSTPADVTTVRNSMLSMAYKLAKETLDKK